MSLILRSSMHVRSAVMHPKRCSGCNAFWRLGDLHSATVLWHGNDLWEKMCTVPGTLNNLFLMDGNGETTIFHVKIWNHPIETTIYEWMFQVPASVCICNWNVILDPD